jgi:hypothetical protein
MRMVTSKMVEVLCHQEQYSEGFGLGELAVLDMAMLRVKWLRQSSRWKLPLTGMWLANFFPFFHHPEDIQCLAPQTAYTTWVTELLRTDF